MRWLVALAFCLSGAQVYAASGSMDCKVTKQTIISVEEGLPKTYGKYTGRFAVGDTLTFSYDADPYSVRFTLKDVSRDQSSMVSAVQLPDIRNAGQTWAGEDKLGWGVVLSEDFVNLYDSFRRLVLRRYYKSDYEGLYVDFIPVELTTQVVTLDCRTVEDGFDDVISVLKKHSSG